MPSNIADTAAAYGHVHILKHLNVRLAREDLHSIEMREENVQMRLTQARYDLHVATLRVAEAEKDEEDSAELLASMVEAEKEDVGIRLPWSVDTLRMRRMREEIGVENLENDRIPVRFRHKPMRHGCAEAYICLPAGPASVSASCPDQTRNPRIRDTSSHRRSASHAD